MKTIRAAGAAFVLTATTATALGVLGATPASSAAPDPAGATWPDRTVGTVGKLVAEFPGGGMESCSGSVVDSANGSVVATAAHCIENPERGKPPRAVYFVPGYDRGGGPEAVVDKGWRTTTWETAPGWDVSKPVDEILPHDWAFLRFPERNGKTLAEKHGSNALRFGPVGGGPTLSLGYPAVSPYDGETLKYCRGKARAHGPDARPSVNAGALTLRPCRLTQGVSGGPWLRDYDASRQSGTLVGVTSLGGENELLGRPFPEAAERVHARMAGTAPR
ncbi:trypsin-like peptidase domain-containing protein [Streptomyces sp. HNM0574]|uniref:trypsin-like serine peptidase n=1 Tax=Streptomyces sp. HNM0574 TaxID=2714954 RepID=UPI00146BD24F|nr:trypsin-like peptidase domain-containing protein [Streptomyces sp. HNM0574]NLU68593.1 hypothetical protein [Streptomyces sp. HNM0574]